MTIRDAWGFLLFGLMMGCLPMIAPAWFVPTGIDGASTRALWLEFMGLVQTAIGGGRVLWQLAVPALVRWLTYVPQTMAPVVPFNAQPARDAAAFPTPVLGELKAAA